MARDWKEGLRNQGNKPYHGFRRHFDGWVSKLNLYVSVYVFGLERQLGTPVK